MTAAPAPLVAPDVDLRGFAWMPLDTVRLLDSDFFGLSSGEEFKAGVALWLKAWQQVPAASLPNDDRLLAHLSGSGSRWSKVKVMALRGFVLCSDGRLYHPVIAEKALEAWKHRQAQRARAAKRWHGNAGAQAEGHAAASPAAMQGTRQDQTVPDKTETEKTKGGAALRAAPPRRSRPGTGARVVAAEWVKDHQPAPPTNASRSAFVESA